MENKNILDNMPNKSPDETTLKKDKIHKECMPLENENSPPKNENLTKDKNMFAELFGINVNKYVEKRTDFRICPGLMRGVRPKNVSPL